MPPPRGWLPIGDDSASPAPGVPATAEAVGCGYTEEGGSHGGSQTFHDDQAGHEGSTGPCRTEAHQGHDHLTRKGDDPVQREGLDDETSSPRQGHDHRTDSPRQGHDDDAGAIPIDRAQASGPDPAQDHCRAHGGGPGATRQRVPRTAHAEFSPAANRPDPVDLLESQSKNRVQELIPVRYGRMMSSAFAFLPGLGHR